MTTTQTSIQKLWDKWLQEADMDAANKLVKSYMYLVTFHVERISSHLPSNVHKDDLFSLAYMGLFDALKRFDPKRDLKFDTYASFRIRGSILDGLRKEDWLPRSLRDKTKKVEAMAEKLEQQYQRTPRLEEIAKKLNMPTEEVETIIRDSLFSNILSIEQKPKEHSDQDSEGIGYVIADEDSLSPDEHTIQAELKQTLAEAIKSLNKNEQLVISLFYHDELTMTEIGEVLNLTTSRISQIHKQALFKMRKILQEIPAHFKN